MNLMKMCFVTDDLIQRGGQEKLVMDMCSFYPDPVLYTTAASKYWQKECKKSGIKLVTSFMQRLPFTKVLNRMYSVFLLHSIALERFNFDRYDLVVSISARYAHQIITKPKTLHVCYMNSPGRMFWESHNYFKNEKFRFLQSFLSYPLNYMRILDSVAAHRVDYFIANARTPQARIKKYYKKDSKIIYPGVGIKNLPLGIRSYENGGYFLVISRLVSWKRIEIAIMACNELGLELKIIGEGPDKKRLQNYAGPKVEFLGYAQDEIKEKILLGCRGLINTQEEDFGIVPIEAAALGKPVIAFGAGGALETVVAGVTGEFFDEQSVKSLRNVLGDFDETKYNIEACRSHAEKFSMDNFEAKIRRYLNDVYLLHANKL